MDELDKLKLPTWFEDIIANQGLAFAWHFQNTLVEGYVDKEIYKEMHGIAETTNVDDRAICRLRMLGEITWATNNPMQSVPSHSSRRSMFIVWPLGEVPLWAVRLFSYEHWTGIRRGSTRFSRCDGREDEYLQLTSFSFVIRLHRYTHGMSSTWMGISEIGIYFSDDTSGDESMSGLPFIFVERHILQFSETLDDTLSFLANVKRTCHLVLAVADGKLQCELLRWPKPTTLGWLASTSIEHCLLWCGLDLSSYRYKFYQQSMYQYGQTTPASSIPKVTWMAKTGDLHVDLYDLTDNSLK